MSPKESSTSRRSALAEDAVVCPVCGIRYNLITAGHAKKHGFSSALELKRKYGMKTLKAPSLCRRHSKLMSDQNPMSGRVRTEDEKHRISEARKGKGVGVCGKYERTDEIRDKISLGVTNAMRERGFTKGEWASFRKTGGAIFCRSTWECRVAKILDRHPGVVRFQHEPFVIKYVFKGVTRRYTPDFLVEMVGGIVEVWEVKPRKLLQTSRNQAKVQALNLYVREKEWNSRLVSKQDIEEMESTHRLRAPE